MKWLNKIVDEILSRHPEGEVLVESGGSPSGTYHLGHLRELVISDAILLELKNRGRKVRHVYYSDDLDALRKIPLNVPAEFEKYLGMPLCKIPPPGGKGVNYADYFLQDLINAGRALNIEVEFVRTHIKYQEGFFVPAIEKALEHIEKVRNILETISGHKLGEEWSPIQINEEGYLKKRRFISIDKSAKAVTYQDKDGTRKTLDYTRGDVKLDWRIDWPARWWLLKVHVEPFGRDHATKGGSYDTGAALSQDVFGSKPPLPVPYDFVNLAGDTKKMSASKGTGLDAAGAVKVLPPEIVRFFMLRYPPSKRLYFDPENGVPQLIDEFAELMAKEPDSQLIKLCQRETQPIISRIPFSHIVASYQSALKNPNKTLKILERTGYADEVNRNPQVLRAEINYAHEWLEKWAPEDVKFELRQSPPDELNDKEKSFLNDLAEKIIDAPEDADGEWFHKAIYDLKDSSGLEPKQLFEVIYKATIGKTSGPRAGWFLSILPRKWLLNRLTLEA